MHAEDWTENDVVRFSRLCACASNRDVLVQYIVTDKTYTHSHDVCIPTSKTSEMAFALRSFKCKVNVCYYLYPTTLTLA